MLREKIIHAYASITKEQSYAMQKWESACCQTIAMQKRREKVK